MIKVQRIDDNTYKVTVEADSPTSHTVTLNQNYYEQLTQRRVSPETLIEKSFAFLLEREPNTSILRSFDLPVIGRYFPEYKRTIQNRIKNP